MLLSNFSKWLYSLWIFKDAKKYSQKQTRLINIFFGVTVTGALISLLGAVLYYVYAYAALSAGDHSFDWLLGIFSDFVYIMDVSLTDSPYVAEDSSYPPFAIVILYPFALICKTVFEKYTSQQLFVDELTSRVILHPQFWIAIVLFFALCSAAIIIALTKLYRLTPKTALKIATIILTSAPFAFTVMRGNTIYFALIFTVLFLILEKSSHAAVREIGYLCLVFAGLIKIYPLFFGVFLLCKKRIWASIRVAIYSLILFFASFLLFRGGEDLLPFFKNLGGFASNDTRLTAPNNLSLSSLLNKLASLISPSAMTSSIFKIGVAVILVALFFICAICAILTKNNFSRHIIVSSTIILIPPISYFYVLIFTILPFIEFITAYDKISSAKRAFYTFAFIFIFFTPTMLAQNYIVHLIIVASMLTIELLSVIKEKIPARQVRSE